MKNFTKKIKLSIAILFAVSFFAFTGQSSTQSGTNDVSPKYSLVKIYAKGEQDMKSIMREGLFFDHAEAHGEYLETWLSEIEIGLLQRSGVRFETEIEDFEKYYNDQKILESQVTDVMNNVMDKYAVTHSIMGTMGGYLKLDEVIAKLDSMRLEYPNLISEKFSIGNSFQNRPMWTVRVSNSPNATTGRTEVWIHSLIHAREPMSMQQSIYFIYWLLENYNTDPVANYILSNRELYFTPVFNPDGYEYNRSTNPNGGGMWRKNRRSNTGGSFGVDLNRNYGIYAFWNSTNNGSSTDPTSDTYRGVSPFSEPETQNARDFVNSRNFKGILSYHTYGNYLIRPWGFVDAPSPDENIYQKFSEEMAFNNHFTLGRSFQTVAYGVRGVTDDWYYNDSGHTKAIAMTPEVGTATDGFWPLQTRIVTLAKSTLAQNIYFSLSCGDYVAPLKTSLDKEQYNQGEQGILKVNFKNKGLINAQNVKIELTSLSSPLTIQTNAFTYAGINSFVNDSVSFNFNVGANAISNAGLKAVLTFKQDNKIVYTQDVYVPVGNGTVLLIDSAENGLTKWTTTAGGWNVTTTQSYSPNNSFTDSPTGNYGNSVNRTLTLKTPINVSGNPVLYLSFWYKHTIDTLDNAYVDISNDSGRTWEAAKFYNKVRNTWTREVIDITTLANGAANLRIRFAMVTNGTVASDGIYIDNIKLTAYSTTPTSITNNTELPLNFSLSQNYPNPFNPTTIINYELGITNYVSLKVYDALGSEVMTLVNENKQAGMYSISFDGSNLPSGMYYYKLFLSGEVNFTDTKKMLLIK